MTTSSADDGAAVIVQSLLDAAALTVPDDELDGFVAVYPIMRAQADGLYLPALEPEAPSLHFDPTVGYA